jgi:CRP-like cAMP-binding protein
LDHTLPNALTRRLEEYTPLTDADRAELARLCSQSNQVIAAKRDLIREGDTPRSVYVILDGWACHYRTLENGRRQIVDFAIPGDLCDLNLFILDRMDHSISAITRLKVAEVGRDFLHRVVTNFPNITTALWWVELVSKSIHREWIVNVGQRSAGERIAHLFCEMFLRLELVGLTDGFSCDFPLTQTDIAETTGLTGGSCEPHASGPQTEKIDCSRAAQADNPRSARASGGGVFQPRLSAHSTSRSAHNGRSRGSRSPNRGRALNQLDSRRSPSFRKCVAGQRA